MATFWLPLVTDSRVPRCSETSDTKPYASSGTIAAMPSSSAKRVAMWRIFISVGRPAGRRRGSPQPERAQDIPSWLGVGHDEAFADRSGVLRPGQEDRRRILDDRVLKRGDTLAVLVVRGGVADAVERGIHRGA